MAALRTWIWIVVSCHLVVLFGIPLIISRLINRRLPWLIGRSWGVAELWLLKVMCGLSFSVEGEEHIGKTPCVALIKHSSAYETVAQLIIFPQQCWVLKQQLIWTPFFGWALMALGAIPINRSAGRSAVTKVMAIGKERIEQGSWVTIFPEGTRVPAGATKRWGISGILLAQEARVDIVAVAHNAGYFWPKDGWTIYPGKIRFVIGKPINPVGQEPRELAEELRSWVDAETEKLTPKG